MQFGRPCRNSRWPSPAPMPRAATTKSRSRSSSSRGPDHARQHRPGQQRDDEDCGPDAGAGDRGEHQQQDHRRQRHGEIDEAHGDAVDDSGRRSADSAPTRKPMTSEMATEVTATSSEMRPPCSSRARTSRPTPSVPNQWVARRPACSSRAGRCRWAEWPPEADRSGSARACGHRMSKADKRGPVVDEAVEARGQSVLCETERERLRHASQATWMRGSTAA